MPSQSRTAGRRRRRVEFARQIIVPSPVWVSGRRQPARPGHATLSSLVAAMRAACPAKRRGG
ncbi:hypothetical protein B0T26DRAFT_689178 [Lasiosphaeria miniovina]|uniref:Uncharacterized protein n=1 Tax=Lasiosphaeria miniovina TaxID=1954250 RepID=A0AA40BI25_9PEZI|nr:uncharacterized protein B0T26DRAFT_689178 [Lasiosphaeria miniovina]KAK0734638.1 hypothetical protein B0T26DRAFT_689178 [Lasiosphaeria miniovina]